MSSDNGNISYWIGGYYYGAKGEGSLCETPYYAENLIYMGILDPKIYLGYILQQDAKNNSYSDLVLALDIVDDILVELTRVVGGDAPAEEPEPNGLDSKLIVIIAAAAVVVIAVAVIIIVAAAKKKKDLTATENNTDTSEEE